MLIIWFKQIQLKRAKKRISYYINNNQWNRAIQYIERLIHNKRNYRNEEMYLLLSSAYRKNGQLDDAYATLESCVNNFSESAQVNYELAILAMERKTWPDASKHWISAYKSGRVTKMLFSQLGKALRKQKKYNGAKKYLEIGLSYYPGNPAIQKELAETYMQMKKWKKAFNLWERIIHNNKTSRRSYLRASVASRKAGKYEECNKIIEKGLSLYPNDRKLKVSYAKLADAQYDWTSSRKRWEIVCYQISVKPKLEEMLSLAMANHLIGNFEKAQMQFEECISNNKQDIEKNYIDCYKKVVLYDNGETRIEFYKKLMNTDSIFVTFDSWHMNWDDKPFGYDFLKRQKVDIIAVRKKQIDSSHQELSIGEFEKVVRGLITNYSKRAAYGLSMGGYSVLYYCANLECNILALSPRNPFHPVYGTSKRKGTLEFTHNLSNINNPNSKTSPVVVYDEKDKIDNNYVEKELKKVFPNANFISFPYSSHITAKYLLEVGILKDLVLKVLNGEEIPPYSRKNRGKSFRYLVSLSEACIKHRKYKWALHFTEKAMEISPHSFKAKLIKVKALMNLGETEAAIVLAKDTLRVKSKERKLKGLLLLIDLYLMNGEPLFAQKEIEKYSKQFENSRKLAKREKTISELLKIKEV